MSHEARIGSRQLRDLVDALLATGVDAGAACREVGLDAARLREEESVPARLVLALLDSAARRARDPYIGLHAGERSKPAGPLAFLLMSSAGLEAGIRQAARFAGLTISTLRIEVESEGDLLNVIYDLGDETVALHRQMIDYLLMANLRSIWRATEERFPLQAVYVRFPARGDDTEELAFGCPVRFDHAYTRWVVDAREFDRIPPLANPMIARQIEDFAAALLAQSSPTAPLRVRVAAATRRLLASGVRAERADVARQLGMSERTLRRRLETEETTFKSVRDAVVWEVVEALLSNPALKIEAIALSTGFADAAAFSKAFKRWASCAPTTYRRRLIEGRVPALPSGEGPRAVARRGRSEGR